MHAKTRTVSLVIGAGKLTDCFCYTFEHFYLAVSVTMTATTTTSLLLQSTSRCVNSLENIERMTHCCMANCISLIAVVTMMMFKLNVYYKPGFVQEPREEVRLYD